jgi:membrane associated rhomboid family serine protease
MLIPQGDKGSKARITLLTWVLVGLNIFIFVYELRLPINELDRFILTWALIPKNLIEAFKHPLAAQSWQTFSTLLTSQFMHSGFLHIIGNMVFLYTFGPEVEHRFGLVGYILFYLAGGVVAGITQVIMMLLFPAVGPLNIPIIGASGAIAGLLGAHLVLAPGNVIYLAPFRIPVPAIILIVWWFVQQVLDGYQSLSPAIAQSGIATWAHIGGFVMGMAVGVMFRAQPKKEAPPPLNEFWMERKKKSSRR